MHISNLQPAQLRVLSEVVFGQNYAITNICGTKKVATYLYVATRISKNIKYLLHFHQVVVLLTFLNQDNRVRKQIFFSYLVRIINLGFVQGY